jgi:hypothetical protein
MEGQVSLADHVAAAVFFALVFAFTYLLFFL